MLDLRELLELLEDAEEKLLADSYVPDGLDKAISLLHKEIHGKD